MAWTLRPSGLVIPENTSPATPASGERLIYPNVNGRWAHKNNAGAVRVFGAPSLTDPIGAASYSEDVWQAPPGQLLNPSAGVAAFRSAPSPDIGKIAAIYTNVTMAGVVGTPTTLNQGSAPTVTAAASSSSVGDTSMAWYEISTSAVLGNIASIVGNSQQPWEDFQEFGCFVVTPATITTTRIFIGLFGGALTNADTPMTNTYIGFRYSATANSNHWLPISHNGTTPSAGTAMSTLFAASTKYFLKWRRSGSTVFFSINNGTEQAESSMNLPAVATSGAIMQFGVIAGAASARSLVFGRMYTAYP